MRYHPDVIVRSCSDIESGLRLGVEGLRACMYGAICSPLYWSAEELSNLTISKEMIVEKRKWLFGLLNDKESDIPCKRCHMVHTKRYGDVNFSRLGHIDLVATKFCNLRCAFCGFTQKNLFGESQYDALAILKLFSADEVNWDAAVELNGGEPSLSPILDDYIAFFVSRGIRMRLMTNGVKFHQSIYDGLVNGTIMWVCTSIDAGCPSTYSRLKKRDYYLQVLENCSRYAFAGSQGGGMFAAKYIFCDENCGDDDISGFSYAMLAILPQKVWLTFDFTPITIMQSDREQRDSQELPDSFDKYIEAYAKMYLLMQKHGLAPTHYSETHLAAVCKQGLALMEKVRMRIKKTSMANDLNAPSLLLKDFRLNENSAVIRASSFYTKPLRIQLLNQDPLPWSLLGKRVLLAPACALSTSLLADPDIRQANLVGFLDRDSVLQGKSIEGIPIYDYKAIPALEPEIILIAAPEQHQRDILQTVAKYFRQAPCNVAVRQIQ